MWPDEEDEPLAGPVPDPSERSWRHPSEIGAGFAMPDGASSSPTPGDVPDATGEQPIPVGAGASARSRSLLWPASVLSGCIAAATLGVVVLYLAASPTTFSDHGTDGRLAAGSNRSDGARTARGPTEPIDHEPREGSVVPTSLAPSITADNQRPEALSAESRIGDSAAEVIDSDTTLPRPAGVDQTTPNPALAGTGLHDAPEVVVSPVGPGLYSSAGEDAEMLAGITYFDGLVLTSAGAIDGRVSVTIAIDGRWLEAAVIGIDRWSDVAVLQPTGEDVPLESLTPSGLPGANASLGIAVEVGPHVSNDPILAEEQVEAPSDESVPGSSTTTSSTGAGAVAENDESAATGTSGSVINVGSLATSGHGTTFHGLILSDIPFRSGLAGAPLLDDEGRLVGIVVDSDGPNISALPVDDAMRLARSLTRTGTADASNLGFDHKDSANNTGVDVLKVAPNGPAAGLLRPKDRVTAINSEKITDGDHLVAMVREAGVDAVVKVRIRRDGKNQTFDMTVAG